MAVSPNQALAWAAGFFDGEGSISIYLTHDRSRPLAGPRRNLQIRVGQNRRFALERFQEIVGGDGSIYGGYVEKLGRHPSWWWTTQNFAAERILRKLLPYLVVKRAEAEIALEYRASVHLQPGGPKLTDADLAAVKAFGDRIRLYRTWS